MMRYGRRRSCQWPRWILREFTIDGPAIRERAARVARMSAALIQEQRFLTAVQAAAIAVVNGARFDSMLARQEVVEQSIEEVTL